MIDVRRWVGVLLALALAGFATTSLAQPKLKTFDLQGFDQFGSTDPNGTQPNFITGQTKGPFEIKVVNNSPDTKANFNSFRLFAPRGFKIVDPTAGTNGTRTGSVSGAMIWTAEDSNKGRSYITVTSIRPSVGASSADNFFAVSLKVTATCVESTGSWTGQVYSGGDLSGANFEYKKADGLAQDPRVFTSTSTGTTACVPSVKFVDGREPRNATLSSGVAAITAEANKPGGNRVQVQVMVGNDVNAGYNGPVQLVVSGPSAATNIGPLNAVAGIATFDPPPQVTAVGRYSLLPKAGTLEGTSVSILVSDKILKCVTYDSNGDPVYTDARVTYGTSVPDHDFWEFVRYQFVTKSGCDEVNYVTTFGATDSSTKTDANGYTIGDDFWSVVYDRVDSGVLLTHTFTTEERPLIGGFPKSTDGKVKYCKGGGYPSGSISDNKDCTKPLNLAPAQACKNANIHPNAIPAGEPGCLRELGWFVAACPSGMDLGSGCYKYSFEVLEATDPPWGMTDE